MSEKIVWKIPFSMTNIRVFCVFSSKLFVVPYPSTDNGWVHRIHVW